MHSEKLLISNRDGYQLHADYYKKDSGSRSDVLVILCHGFTGDRSEWGRYEKTASSCVGSGWDAVLFDFSGSGENERIPVTLDNQVRDLEDVAAWGIQLGYGSIVTIGLSFGGITSLIAKVPNRKVAVFWAPAFYLERIAGNFKKKLANMLISLTKKPLKIKSVLMDKSFFEGLWHTDVNLVLQNFDIPSIIVHGTKDKTVLPSDSQKAFDLMKKDGKHELHFVKGTDHDFEKQYLDEFISVSIDFIKKHLGMA